jgi:putative phosphoesterase
MRVIVKIAVLADIHGNLPALLTVAADIESWRPDVVVVAGDVVNRGPRSRDCLLFVGERQRQDGWLVVRGNHEDYVLSQARPDRPLSGPEYEIALNSLWTYRDLNGEMVALEKMPFQISVPGPHAEEMRIVHASMLGNRAGIYPESTAEELRHRIAPPPEVLVAGHTHRPLIRRLDETLVVNVGSVGMPFDGNDRAAYGRFTKSHGIWQSVIIRLNYDKAQTERDFFETGFIPQAGDLARIMLLEFHQARSHIFNWVYQYQPLVLAGQLSVADSVAQYLAINGQ